MTDWLSIDLVLAAFIFSATTSFGLISLWAARSTRHWFIRFTACFVTISPLLLLPAYEPFVAFAIEGFVVAIGIAAYGKRVPHRRFSLSGVLLATLLVAIVIVIAVRLPPLNLRAWLSVAMIGVAAGIATLFGALCFSSSRKALTWTSGLVTTIAIGIALSMFDWFIPSIVGIPDWPPDPVPGFFDPKRPVIAWFFIPSATLIAVALFLYLWHAATDSFATASPTAIAATSSVRRKRRTVGTLAYATVLAALPLYVLIKLLIPDAIPESTIPNPNGRDDLIAAGQIAATTQFDGTLNIETASAQQLILELKKCEKAFELVTAGLQKQCIVPVDYSAGLLPMEEMMASRAIGRALSARGKLAELENRFSDAADSYRDAIDFGYNIRRGGLLIDGMIGTACSHNGSAPLYFIRAKLPANQINQLINKLIQLDASEEPYTEYEERDRIWGQRATGWHGHLSQILSEIFDTTRDFVLFDSDDIPLAFATHTATIRLLICELALAQFHKDHSRWPASLDELVPKYLPSIPVDPYTADNTPLRYRPTNDGYVIYSVGPNRTDDGGTTPEDSEGLMGVPKSGDLRLDIYFAPEPEDGSGGQSSQPTPSNSAGANQE